MVVKKDHLSIKRPLSLKGMRRIFNLIDTPTKSIDKLDYSREMDGKDEPKMIADTSQNYFHRVRHFLDGLKYDKDNVKTIASISVWLDKYARKIDRLSMLNVYPDLLTYGANVSSQLQDASLAIKGIDIQPDTRQAPAHQNPGYRYGRFGCQSP